MDPLHIEFRDIVTWNIKILTFFGYFPFKTKSKFVFVAWVISSSLLTGVTYFGMVLCQSVGTILSFRDGFIKGVKISCISLTNIFSFIKLIFIYTNRHRILALVTSTNRKEFRPRNLYQRKILARYIKKTKILTCFLLISVTVICCIWYTQPSVVQNNRRIPASGFIPLNLNNTINYFFTYTFEVFGGFVGAWCCLTADGLVAGIIMVVCAQLDILNDSLENLHTFALEEITDQSDKNAWDKAMIKNIVKCVHHHQAIVKFAQEVESIFTVPTLGQFWVSVLTICTSLFTLFQMKKDIRFVSIVIYVADILIEVFILCYFGHEVITKHSQLTTSAYKCDWQKCSKRFKCNLLIFMMNTQTDLKLLAGGYVTLSNDTFIAIMKSSLSYYTVLNNINDADA